MGNTFGPKGFFKGSKTLVSKSKYAEGNELTFIVADGRSNTLKIVKLAPAAN